MRSPFCSLDSGGGAESRSVEPLVLASLVFGLFTAEPVKMRGSSRTCEGVKALMPGLRPRPGIVMKRRYEAAPLAVEGVANCKFGVSAVAIFGEVWGL